MINVDKGPVKAPYQVIMHWETKCWSHLSAIAFRLSGSAAVHSDVSHSRVVTIPLRSPWDPRLYFNLKLGVAQMPSRYV